MKYSPDMSHNPPRRVPCPECRGDKCIVLRDEQTGRVLSSRMCPRCDGFGVVDAEQDEEGREDE